MASNSLPLSPSWASLVAVALIGLGGSLLVDCVQNEALLARINMGRLSTEGLKEMLLNVHEPRNQVELGSYNVQELLDVSNLSEKNCQAEKLTKYRTGLKADGNLRLLSFYRESLRNLVEFCRSKLEEKLKSVPAALTGNDEKIMNTFGMKLPEDYLFIVAGTVRPSVDFYLKEARAKTNTGLPDEYLRKQLENSCRRVLKATEFIEEARKSFLWHEVDMEAKMPWAKVSWGCQVYVDKLAPSVKAVNASKQ